MYKFKPSKSQVISNFFCLEYMETVNYVFLSKNNRILLKIRKICHSINFNKR